MAPGEGPLFMAEELAFEKGVRDGGTIDGKEGLFGPEAVVIDRPGEKLLARSALPPEKDGDVALADLAHHLVDLLHLGREPDDPLLPLPLRLAAEA